MANCCICKVSVKKEINIFQYSIGKPPVLLSDLINECIEGTKYVINSTGICKKCTNTLNRYQRAKQILSQVKKEVLELFLNAIHTQVDKCTESQTFAFLNNVAYSVFKIENETGLLASVPKSQITIEDSNSSVTNYEDMLEEFIEDDIEDVLITENLYEGAAVVQTEGEVFESIGLEIEECYIANAGTDLEIIGIQDLSVGDLKNNNAIYIGDTESILDVDNQKSIKRKLHCSKCNQGFNETKEYREHYKKFHFAGYICDECGKTLYSYSGFLNHKQGHNPVKKFECPDCGERYHLKIQLKYHMAWHTGEKPFQCDICSKQFVHRVALYKHKKLHESNERRYGCYICGSRFRTSAHLRRHSMTHTGAKPHSCPICGKCFAQAYNMRVHLREHNKPESTRSKRNLHQCEKCCLKFSSKKEFVGHIVKCPTNVDANDLNF